MKVASDTWINGERTSGELLPPEQLTEVQAADHTCWAHVAIPEGMTVTAKIKRDQSDRPKAIDVKLNPSWVGPVLETDAPVSARQGWPRLAIELVPLPEPAPDEPAA